MRMETRARKYTHVALPPVASPFRGATEVASLVGDMPESSLY